MTPEAYTASFYDLAQYVPLAVWVTVIFGIIRLSNHLGNMNQRLISIDDQFKKLNGKVTNHETRISRIEGARNNGSSTVSSQSA